MFLTYHKISQKKTPDIFFTDQKHEFKTYSMFMLLRDDQLIQPDIRWCPLLMSLLVTSELALSPKKTYH